jgi:hypothetical protein
MPTWTEGTGVVTAPDVRMPDAALGESTAVRDYVEQVRLLDGLIFLF